MPYPAADFSRIRTFPLQKRDNRVALSDLVQPAAPPPPFENPELQEVAQAIALARQNARPVILSFGAHVVKRGLGLLVIDLIRRGLVTHLASNGAAAIHDFEIAMQGGTSEDVLASLADGSFGMAEETGAWMIRAVREGARDGLGMGEALGRLVAQDERFPYREASILAAAWQAGVPWTVHVALGTDIIHQHPEADFAALGWASGQDFKVFVQAVCGLEGGVFLNFGSAVIGPEVFLKAVSIARNLGNPLRVFTTANFDLLPLADYRAPLGEDKVEYYYRPRKNIVNRPVALGGVGYHICGDHAATLPNLRHAILAHLGDWQPPVRSSDAQAEEGLPPTVEAVRKELLQRNPALEACEGGLVAAWRRIVRAFACGGTLFTCGNGGSMADALHITGELAKSFHRKRPLPPALRARLGALEDGDELGEHLQQGLRSVTLGASLALSSAVLNDNPLPSAGLAQELLALGRPGDVLLALSTSGNARNVLQAARVAKAMGMDVIALTGEGGGKLAGLADIALRAPARGTPAVQELHVQLYHALCSMLEEQFFAEEES